MSSCKTTNSEGFFMYKQATELMLNFKDRILIKGEEDTG
ncbi:TPA: ATP-binding protein, partial [Escherichia coli]